MARPRKYATEEERISARRAKVRENVARHREKHGRPSRSGYEPWTPRFIGIDGESFVTDELLSDGTPKQAYCLLLRHDKKAIYNPDGLSTWQCLRYLTGRPPKKTALVGFFLNFDFEWILKDLTQDEYKALQHGDTVEVFDGEYRLQWFVGKKLVVHRLKGSARKKEKSARNLGKDYVMTSFQDVQGFFQTSFISALKKWGFQNDSRLKIITSGKAARGGFQKEDLEEVARYNATEMELLEELMMKVYDSFKAAYETAGLDFRVNSQTWSGPGVFANDFLKQTFFNEQHNPPSEELVTKFGKGKFDDFGNGASFFHPFSLAYFGGRIELAGVGRFGKGWNYDLNSGYPYALSLLPRWSSGDFIHVDYVGLVNSKEGKAFLERRLMGMYKIRFNFPEGWTWYPFPVRSVAYGTPNVYYPRQGVTYVMAPELFAVLDTLPKEELKAISILEAIVIDSTDGYGDALNRMDESRLSLTALKTLNMAAVRLDCKAAGKRVGTTREKPGDFLLALAEKALKLILNSLYGKTVQQIGSHKYYNDFAAAWITSTCRALLWRAIVPERKTNHVLMTMTDGIYSLKPLPFAAERLTSMLGDWEETPFRTMETFKPGIYRYEHQNKKGDWEMDYKVRGFLTPTLEDKERLFDLIWQSATTGIVGQFPAKQFLTRNVALQGWKREPWLRQFYVDRKDIRSELKAKRDKGVYGWLIEPGERHAFFPPKGTRTLNHSKGYALNFENEDLTEDDVEEYLLKYDANIGIEEFYQ